jgi:hypothetical protein
VVGEIEWMLCVHVEVLESCMKRLLLLYVEENLLECNELRRIEEEQKVKECRIFLPFVLVFVLCFIPLFPCIFPT